MTFPLASFYLPLLNCSCCHPPPYRSCLFTLNSFYLPWLSVLWLQQLSRTPSFLFVLQNSKSKTKAPTHPIGTMLTYGVIALWRSGGSKIFPSRGMENWIWNLMKELCRWPLNLDNVKYNICTKGLAIWIQPPSNCWCGRCHVGWARLCGCHTVGDVRDCWHGVYLAWHVVGTFSHIGWPKGPFLGDTWYH